MSVCCLEGCELHLVLNKLGRVQLEIARILQAPSMLSPMYDVAPNTLLQCSNV